MEDSVPGATITATAIGNTVLAAYSIIRMCSLLQGKMVSYGLNQIGIKPIYWFITNINLTRNQWTVHIQDWNQKCIR